MQPPLIYQIFQLTSSSDLPPLFSVTSIRSLSAPFLSWFVFCHHFNTHQKPACNQLPHWPYSLPAQLPSQYICHTSIYESLCHPSSSFISDVYPSTATIIITPSSCPWFCEFLYAGLECFHLHLKPYLLNLLAPLCFLCAACSDILYFLQYSRSTTPRTSTLWYACFTWICPLYFFRTIFHPLDFTALLLNLLGPLRSYLTNPIFLICLRSD